MDLHALKMIVANAKKNGLLGSFVMLGVQTLIGDMTPQKQAMASKAMDYLKEAGIEAIEHGAEGSVRGMKDDM